MPNEPPAGFNDPLYDQNSQISKLEQEMKDLKNVVQQIANASAIECVLQNGFEELAEKLAPLRELAPTRTPMKDYEYKQLQNMRVALARPDWSRRNEIASPTSQPSQTAGRYQIGSPVS
jgi:hypothetical protein